MLGIVVKEIKEHLPFTIMSSALGIIVVGLVSASLIYEDMFHVLHPLHILFSSIATTSLFWLYDKRIKRAVVVGFVGSILICSVSDIVIPAFGILLLGLSTGMHVCLIEHPMLVLPYALLGIVVGLIAAERVGKSTEFSHSAHVFISTFASLFYLLSFGLANWSSFFLPMLVILFLAVLVPCCTSDIIFPLMLVRNKKKKFK